MPLRHTECVMYLLMKITLFSTYLQHNRTRLTGNLLQKGHTQLQALILYFFSLVHAFNKKHMTEHHLRVSQTVFQLLP